MLVQKSMYVVLFSSKQAKSTLQTQDAIETEVNFDVGFDEYKSRPFT